MASALQLSTTPPLPGNTAVPAMNIAWAALAGSPKSTIASAATVDLGSVATLFVEVSGSVAITSFGNNANLLQDQFKWVRFTGAPLVTYNASSLITLTAANIQTQAGDLMCLTYLGSGNWRVIGYWSLLATQAQAETGTNNTAYSSPLRVAEAIVSLTQNFKNIVGRNGGFEVWQRGAGGSASIAVAASTTLYTADGWFLKTGANQSFTVAQIAGLGNNSGWCARVQRDSGQTGTSPVYFEFPLDTDEVYKLRGKTVVLSFRTATGADWSPASGTLTYNLYCGTGTPTKRGSSALTGETNPLTGSINFAAGAADSLNITPVSSAVATTNVKQASLQFSWTPAGTAGANDWIEFDDVQIEVVASGVVPQVIAFERTAFVDDIVRCIRHFRKTFNYATAPAQNVGANTGGLTTSVFSTGGAAYHRFGIPLSPPMRANPTVTLYNPGAANSQLRDVSAGVDFTGSGIDVQVAGWVGVFGLPTVAMGVGDACQIHITVDSGI